MLSPTASKLICFFFPFSDLHVENSTYNSLFDVLRAFPGSSAHSNARLFAWWKFLCVIPPSLLEDGFRRFFTPFLANLLGRYVSITAPLGDLPELQIPASILTNNAYQFEVALFHWLRLLCGRRPSSVHIDRVWIQCIEYLQQAVSKNCVNQPDPAQTRQIFLRQTIETSLRLVFPRDPKASAGSLISPTVPDSSTCPLPNECVVILRGLVKILMEESPSSDLKPELLSMVTFATLNLLSTWHQENIGGFDEEKQRHASELELAQLITELLDCEPRLQAAGDRASLSPSGDFVSLSKDLLDALVPECCRFVSSCAVPEESRDCLPLSSAFFLS
ncbi:unnamed protein product [Dibothriocephalus latus]|uniref:Uncharacterized protein n=1 Tax=Dibothriocephalus latus TaxID=60516 RepID=A0A3P7PS67_DIBLA|nr:unnamed protein product [Dibothriocephalus latus]